MATLLQPTINILCAHIQDAFSKGQGKHNERKRISMQGTHWVSAATNPTFPPSFQVPVYSNAQDGDLYASTLHHSTSQQNEVAKICSTMLVYFIFGSFVPALFLLAPLNSWLNLCCLRWKVSRAGTGHEFGQTLAYQILVHPPITTVKFLALLGNCCVTTSVFVDLQVSKAHNSHIAVSHAVSACNI